MSDSKKIKDLMSRMVEMSPEAPDFPDGVQTARPAQRYRSSAWVFAVAGMAVIVLALPFVLWQGGRDPVAGDPTTPTTVPQATTTTTTPETSSSVPTATPAVRAPWPVFLVQEPTGSPTGNPSLVAFYPVLTPGSDPSVLDSLRAPEDVLFELHNLPVSLPPGFSNAVPDGVKILRKSFQTTAEGLTRVTLDMNREFLAGAGGLLADVTMLNQIIFTTLQFEVHEVLFTVEGSPVEAYGMEGISLLDPVDSRSFIDELNPILLTEAVFIDSDGVLNVRGWANVFEAALSWHIDAGPAAWPAYSGNVMSSCGTGCWGTFEITADLGDRDGDWSSYELWVYSDSAHDGSPTMVVKVPFSAIRILTD